MARQAICEVKCDSDSNGKFAETVVSCKCACCESKAGGGKRSHVAFMSGDLIAVRARIASIRSMGPPPGGYNQCQWVPLPSSLHMGFRIPMLTLTSHWANRRSKMQTGAAPTNGLGMSQAS